MFRLGADPPAGCGQKYAHLVTAGGYGPTNPTGFKPWVSEADVRAWLGTAKTIFDLVRGSWNTLVRAERAAGGNHAASEHVKGYVERYEAGYAALPDPSPLAVAGLNQELQAVIGNAQAGACALELLDQALASVGAGGASPVPWTPGERSFLPDLGGGGAIVPIVLLVLAWAWLDSSGQRRWFR